MVRGDGSVKDEKRGGYDFRSTKAAPARWIARPRLSLNSNSIFRARGGEFLSRTRRPPAVKIEFEFQLDFLSRREEISVTQGERAGRENRV